MGSILGVLNYLRDRPKVDVTLDVGWMSTAFRENDPRGKLVLIRITNTGRRPVYITAVEIQAPPQQRFIIKQSLPGQRLAEGDPPWGLDIAQDDLNQDIRDWSQARAVAWDSAGKKYDSKEARIADAELAIHDN